MKYSLILLFLIGLTIITIEHSAYGLCVSGTDWDKVPCWGRTCYDNDVPACNDPNWWKERWIPYYDYKGSEWMKMKKIELLDAIKDGTLVEWKKRTPNGTNTNVHDYYFYMGEVPNHNGIYVKQYFVGYFPPLKQFKSGIEPKDIVCKQQPIYYELVMKKSNNQPICIKGTSVKALTLRNYIPEYNRSLGGEITSDEIVISIPHALPVIDDAEIRSMMELFQNRYHTSQITYAGSKIILNATNVWGETILLVIQPLDDGVGATLTCNHTDWRKQEIVTENVLEHLQTKSCFASHWCALLALKD